MNPFNAIQSQANTSQVPHGSEDYSINSMTPRRIISQNRQNYYLSTIEVSPMDSLDNLFYPSFNSPRITVPYNYQLKLIQTPVPKYSLTFNIFQQDTHINKEPISIQEKAIFDEEDEYSSTGNENNPCQNDQEEYDQDYNQNQQKNSKEFQGENIDQQVNRFKSQVKNIREKLFDQQADKQNETKRTPCNCKKTQCLKLYCDCFRIGQVCGQKCSCVGCHNTDQYEAQRIRVMEALKKRNPNAFDPKITDQQHSQGCNCKRTSCLKKYCQCYQAGLDCGSHCKCEQCKNIENSGNDFYYKEQRIKQTIKKQRIMKEY